MSKSDATLLIAIAYPAPPFDFSVFYQSAATARKDCCL
jgi:hypothetical protein